MKRKAESRANGAGTKKPKTSLSPEDAKRRFRGGLFDEAVLDAYTEEYATSSPYKHAVIHELVDDTLLRSVRDEIRDNVHFTPKETDIYKIHQSGDLANLDGLDDDSLAKLPSLLALRDAIYSETFRGYVSHITGCGPLSGRKTDMAINVYTPGCFLLCHDDVIGSRRVSYILYLTDPDTPWKPEWGGALRLFPVQEMQGDGKGEVARTPLPDAVKSIPPAWNQLSFFAVQPGESFHDVEEVYHAASAAQLAQDGGRVRMAISGWFHIPQAGEDGFVDGEEERNATNSSLMQLRGNPAQYDTPQAAPVAVAGAGEGEGEREDEDAEDFGEADLEFLLRYLAPTYLTPDTLEQVSQVFEEESSITLGDVLSRKFAQRLREWIAAQERAGLPDDSAAIEKGSRWRVARPPHKHRYLYRRGTADTVEGTGESEGKDKGKGKQKEVVVEDGEESPLDELLNVLLPSRQFRHWLQVATGCTVESHDILARRFRRGRDYTLATGHEGKPRLELTLGLTPTSGWGDAADDEDEHDDDDDDDDDEDGEGGEGGEAAKSKGKGKDKGKGKAVARDEEEDAAGAEVGGHEVYMAGDDDAHEDAAIYKASGEDDNILFFQAAAWNKMSLVLRDSGALKFVKYVSRRAPGDRWDVAGVFGIEDVEGERFEAEGIDAEKEEGAEELHEFEDAEQDEEEDEEDEEDEEEEDFEEGDDDEEEGEEGDGDEFEGLSD